LDVEIEIAKIPKVPFTHRRPWGLHHVGIHAPGVFARNVLRHAFKCGHISIVILYCQFYDPFAHF
jgi:hypothetical protein